VAHSAIWVLLPVGNMAFCHSAGNLFAGARTFSAAKVIKPVTESILPLSERGSWAPPLEERGAGVSFSFRPLGVWRFAVQPGIYSPAKEAGGLFVPSTEVAAAAEAAIVSSRHLGCLRLF
jgi:hypothetical protein